MPRRGKIAKREVLQDPVYGSELVTRLVNNVMLDGKKGVAQKIVYGAFEIVEQKSGKAALEAFDEALNNIMPTLEVRLAVSAAPPTRCPWKSGLPAVRPWVCAGSPPMQELVAKKTMKERLAGEILDAMNGNGGACKKREDTHKMAEANKAFAHYRF